MADVVLSTMEFGDPSGPPLVALHGGGSTGHHWERLATERIPGRRWICPDLRGHGDSSKEGPWTWSQLARDVVATLDSLGVASFDLIGHSLGGAVSIEVARQWPSKVRSVLLLDPGGLMTADDRVAFDKRHADAQSSMLSPRGFDSLDELIAVRSNDELPTDARPHIERELMPNLEHTSAGRIRLRANPQGLTSWAMGFSLASFGDFGGRVLLLYASRYDIVTDRGLSAIRSELGDRLTTVAIDASHALLWVAFDQTATKIKQFLDNEPSLGEAVDDLANEQTNLS